MLLTVPLTMFGWPVIVALLFALLPSRRAVLLSLLLAWLFLPMASFKVPGIPDYTKVTATEVGIVFGTILFDPNRFFALRFKWIDLPMAIWCFWPLATSIHNGLGVYDGISSIFTHTMDWGAPYVIGRGYFGDIEGLRDLAVAILIGGLIYVPLCWFEIILSPQLHNWIYGYHQAPMFGTHRYGGFRPLVFMQNGLAVGLWMVEASIIAIWLWYTKSLSRIHRIPMGALALILFITAVGCKSTGALCLLLIGLALLYICRRVRSSIPLFIFILLIPTYIGMRLKHEITPDGTGAFLSNFFEASRANSFVFRIKNEELLSEKAMQEPIFGWGGWGRSEIKSDSGQRLSITDSLWIIALGHNGLVGLISLFTAMLMPACLAWRRYPPNSSADLGLASLQVISIIQILFAVDCLSNAMINPIYLVAIGGVTSLLVRPVRQVVRSTMSPQSGGYQQPSLGFKVP